MQCSRWMVGAAIAASMSLPSEGRAQDVFHSTQSASLPTATMYPGGSWLFEISHRFATAISEGASALWGLDGPVVNRLGLTYSASDQVAIGIQRSNFDDNLELNAKVGLGSAGGDAFFAKFAVMGGAAWNTEPALVEGAEDNEMQAYAQAILNAQVGSRIALGVVPTYLHNPRIRDFDEESAFAVGLHGQLYVTSSLSLFAEWLFTEGRQELAYDPGTFGLEIETRGHFFKLMVGNQYRLNPTQYLGGAQNEFVPDQWMFGFNIQRLLPF